MANKYSYEDILNEINSKTYIDIKDRNTSYNSEDNYDAKDASYLLKRKNIKNSQKQQSISNIRNALKNNGVILDDDESRILPNAFTIQDKNRGNKDLYEMTKKGLYSPAKQQEYYKQLDQENMAKYNDFMSTDEGRKLQKDLRKSKNEAAIATSNYQRRQAEEDYDNANIIEKAWLKTGGALGRAIFSTLIKSDNRITNDNGESYSLPNYAESLNNVVSENSGPIGKVVNDVFFQTGRLATSAALNTIIPGAGTTTYFTDMYTDQLNEAISEGYSSNQALAYATVGTATEVLTEKVLGSAVGLFSSSGSVETLTSNALKKVISNQAVNKVLSSMASEGVEEFVQEYIDVFNRNLTLGEDNEVFTEENFKNALYSGLVGALSSGSASGIETISQGKVVNTANQIIYDVERANKSNLSNTNKKLIENIIYENIFNGNPNITAQSVVSQFEDIKHQKINNMRESAYNYFVNNEETNNMLDTISKIVYDKNYDITFNNKITNEKGKTVNALINGNQIIINPDSNRALEFLVMHEVTHGIETDSLKKMVLDYAKKDPEYSKKIKDLKNLYNTNDVSSEVLADISGELLGNQEFINSISNSDPTLFNRIYTSIKALAQRVSGNQEASFITKLKRECENAYRNINTSYYSQAFSIQQDTSGNKYVEVDTNQDIFVGIDPKDYNKIAKMYITDYLLGETTLSNTDTAVIDSKSAKKYTNPGNTQYFFDEKMKLTPELKNVMEIATKKSTSSASKANSKYQNWEYYTFNFRLGNQSFEALLNIGVDSKGNKHFYEINNIKKASISGTSLNNRTGSSRDNITQSKDNVKSSTKYSMQEDINNTQGLDNSSFSMDPNAKRYDDLLKTNRIEFFTKDNGDVRVNMIDTNSNLVNQIDLFSNTEAIKQLGEKLGDYIYNRSNYDNQIVRIGNDINNLGNETDYFMNHRPTESGITADNLINENVESPMPKDIYDHPEWYFNMNEKHSKESLEVLKKVRNNPDAEITIYRATPGNKINKGDWITLSKSYAEYHNESQLNGEGNIVEMKVKAKDVQYAGDDINEFGYFPGGDIKYSISNGDIWQKYLEERFPAEGTRTFSKDIRKYGNETDYPITANQRKILPTPKEQSSKSDITLPITRVIKRKNVTEKVNNIIRNKRYRLLSDTTSLANKYLDFNKTEKQTFEKKLSKFTNMSKYELNSPKTFNEIEGLVSQYANREVRYIDNNINEIKDIIRKYRFKDSNYLEDGFDYGTFKKENRGKIIFSEDGQSVDEIYSELSQSYPEYFDRDITNSYDMLDTISDFMNSSSEVVDQYRILEEDLKDLSLRIFNKLEKNSLSSQDIEEIEANVEDKYNNKLRGIVQQELLKEMNISVNDLNRGNDISFFEYQRTDPIRLNEKVFGAKIGKKVNDATIYKTKHNEADRIRFVNHEKDEIAALGIKARSKESAAVQKYAEKGYYSETNTWHDYTDEDLAYEFRDKETQQKIKRAAAVIRNKYDNYIDQTNDVLTSLGYKAIPKRKDYMRHFQELNTKFSKLSELGIPLSDINKDNLPTDINGLTENFKPGKSWFANALKREGIKTTYDAITGIDGYLDSASNLIYHTKDIQRYRTLSKYIRETFGQEHGLDNASSMTAQELNQRKLDIFTGKLSKYVDWLDEQANLLAGKKVKLDRSAERFFGRKVYSVLDTAKKQVGSNMTGFNVRSSLTNFASTMQAASKTQKKSLVKGIISTIQNMVREDGMIDKSDFLTSRFGTNTLSQKLWQKASNYGQIFMEGSDKFTSNIVWRSKYFEYLDSGLNQAEAIKKADDFSARIMGDRSKGATAEMFNSKTLGFLTQFQLETNNYWSSIVHDNKIDIANKEKTIKSVVFELGQLACFSYMFNNLMTSLTGSAVMLDPIDMLKELMGGNDDDDEETTLEERTENVFRNLIDSLLFANVFTGGGRIPTAEAFKGISTGIKKWTGQTDSYGNKITHEDVRDDVIESLFYWILPTGYSQMKKTYNGLKMYDKSLPLPGSYTDSGNLRFRADESAIGKAKSALFGQYSSKEAREYVDGGYKTIKSSKLPLLKNLDIPSNEFIKINSNLNNIKSSADKMEYIDKLDLSTEKKNKLLENVLFNKSNQNELDKIKSFKLSEEQKKSYYSLKMKSSNISSDKSIDSSDKKRKISSLFINNKDLSENQLAYLYSKYYSDYSKLERFSSLNIPIKEVIKLDSQNIKNKNDYIKNVNNLALNIAQKAIIIKSKYSSYTDYDKDIIEYINSQKVSNNEKNILFKSLNFNVNDEEIINYVLSNYSQTDSEEKLKSLGYTVQGGRVYW